MSSLRFRFRRPGPWVQMTMALVALSTALVLLADLFLDALPDREAQTRSLRQQAGEGLAAHVVVLLQHHHRDPERLPRTLHALASQMPDLRSVAVRQANGQLLAVSGNHASHWRAEALPRQAPEQVKVPLQSTSGNWGSVELAFARDERPLWQAVAQQPLVQMLVFITLAGSIIFALYLRRVLQHLDPASAIPDRVQNAFDVMAEGVTVLDDHGRILLVNKAFRNLHPKAAELGPGVMLSSLPWLTASLDSDEREHPWARTIADRAPISGLTLLLFEGTAQERRLMVSCTPITDAGGALRGCMATFDDISALHRTNLALRDAVQALNASNEEVQRQNVELERLATRDALTGCLNRRAFLQAFDSQLDEARSAGTPLSCLMLDIDHFKSVNDRFGHAIGDRVIQEVAKRMQMCARSTDLVGRYGGEEFCMLLPGLDRAGAEDMAERIRQRIEAECAASVREVEGLHVTASLGIEALGRAASTPAQLLDRADQALYLAKRNGRNRVAKLEFAALERATTP